MADAVGAQLHHRRHAHQAQGDGQGKLLLFGRNRLKGGQSKHLLHAR